jgi:hypothetical protein
MGVIREALEPLRQLRHRAHAERLALENGGGAAIAAWRAIVHDTVVGGPFAGMRYPLRWGDASAPAKWLGSYEEELSHSIETLLQRKPDRVVVIGSADGYYTVGCALALRGTRVDGFDPEWLARRNTVRLARENDVSQFVAVHGLATFESLNALLGLAPVPALVISDCEGAEDELIDPVRIPALKGSDLVIELHEWSDASLGDRIVSRFPSHAAHFLDTQQRDIRKYPSLSAIDSSHHSLIVREYRLKQRYLVLVAPR